MTRDQAPDKFRHLITVAIVSLYLGVCEQMSEQRLIQLLCSGLFHDLGEMHLSPALFDRSTQLDAELWRQIYSHPIIIQLILKEFSEYKPEISQAILEHHERLDVSGYPRGISGDQISPLGRILAVAELGVVLMDRRKNETDWDHLVTSIKLNAAKYDPKLIRHMVHLFKNNSPVDSKPVDISKKETQQLWAMLTDLMSKSAVIISTQDPANTSINKFLSQNMDAIQFELSRSGIELDDISSFITQIEDASIELNELNAMAKESLYRIYEIGHQIQRRWPDLVAQQSEESDIKVWLSLSRTL